MKHLTIFSKLRRKKKKKKEEEKTPYGLPIEKETQEYRPSFRERVSQSFSIFSTRRKFNIPSFMRVRRILAGVLCIIYSIVSLMSLTETYSLLFIGTAFILFDYMRQTRKIEWVKKVDET